MFEFQPFDKIARLKREQVITEKLDGTNAQVAIFELEDDGEYAAALDDPYCISVYSGAEEGDSPLAMYVGSRKRWIACEGNASLPKGCDNFGFASWVLSNVNDLRSLGVGRHYGEWYGKGIQRGYGLDEKRFALFNTARWGDHNPNTPICCDVVPVIRDTITNEIITDPEEAMDDLHRHGSQQVRFFNEPEGIVVYHTASRTLYKQTFGNDGGKWREESCTA
jgi:hypothetical protein